MLSEFILDVLYSCKSAIKQGVYNPTLQSHIIEFSRGVYNFYQTDEGIIFISEYLIR